MRPVGDVHGRLGDAVHVHQRRAARRRAARTTGAGSRCRAPRRRRSPSAAPAPGRAAQLVGLDELAERRRRLVEHRHALSRQQRGESSAASGSTSRARPPAGRRRAARPRSPRPRSRTRTSGTASRRRPAPKPNQASVAVNSRATYAVLDHHALGPAGRARRVDDVGEVLGRGERREVRAPAPPRARSSIYVDEHGRHRERGQARCEWSRR